MHHLRLLLMLAWGYFPVTFAAPSPAQFPMEIPMMRARKLQGRFLHITDIHPDSYFQEGSSEKSACHRNKPKKAKPRAGYYGMPFSDCDAPFSLTNYTLDYLDKKWTSDIDFVIWTGDNARHDNDRKLPRTTAEIYDLNRAVAKKMETVFLSKGIPVVPSIGNNDVWPHNIMLPGPNSITSEYSSIWRSFIPFPSFQVFQRGGYYSVEVIPGSVAAISLNTMYFFDSNKAVGGCEPNDPEDPGNLQFDWLEVQLGIFRSRGMQVWLTGHVPPSAKNYFPECHIRYVELSLRYQDTILGHLYGHMNADHFFFLDAEDIHPSAAGDMKHKDLYQNLLKEFSDLPKTPKKIDHSNYAVANVGPAVVPNPYLPSFRIFTYNITGTPYVPDQDEDSMELQSNHTKRRNHLGDLEAVCADAMHRNSWKCLLSQPWHSSPHSPSRQNRLFTPTGYAQYYIPQLDTTKRNGPPEYKLEYLTYPVSQLHPTSASSSVAMTHPIPLKRLPHSLRNATVTESKYAPYEMEDLTISSYIVLAQRLGRSQEKKLRKRFRRYMYMGGDEA